MNPPPPLSMKRGSFPTMITPFRLDSSSTATPQPTTIDWDVVDQLVDWYIDNKCVGIFSPCLSSEMYQLSVDERYVLAERVHKRVAGRVSHVAVGTFGGDSLEAQAEVVRRMALYCDVVVVVTCFLDPQNLGDVEWKKNACLLMDLAPGVPMGLYECPVPFKRLLSPDLLQWCAATNRFHFHKDTCCDPSQIQAKIEAIRKVPGSPFKFYNANVETLKFSVACGGDGFSGISANFYPHFHSWMVETMTSEDFPTNLQKQRDVEALQHFLCVAEATVVIHYPCSAKMYLAQLYGKCTESNPAVSSALPIVTACRIKSFTFSDQDKLRLQDLAGLSRFMADRLGIKEIKPRSIN